MHPLAFPDSTSSFDLGNGPVRAGDRIIYMPEGRTGVLDEALQDGDAFVTWDNGSYGTVHWNKLRKALKRPGL